MLENLTENAKREKLINEFTVACTLKPGWELNIAIQRCLLKAWEQGFDSLDLLYQALRKIKEPDKVNLQEIQVKGSTAHQDKGTSTNEPLSCDMCTRVFEKGVKGWVGNKKNCKKGCTVLNLKPI